VIFDRCPKAWMLENRGLVELVGDVLRFHSRSVMPDAGGYLDQHPHWIQAEEIILEITRGPGRPER